MPVGGALLSRRSPTEERSGPAMNHAGVSNGAWAAGAEALAASSPIVKGFWDFEKSIPFM